MNTNLAKQTIIASRYLSIEGHDDYNQGQISARDPSKPDTFFIKNAFKGFLDVTGDDLCACSIHGDNADPAVPPELPLHEAIYSARTDVGCVIHTHSPNAIAFGALDTDLLPISHEGSFFFENIGRFKRSSQTILDIEMGKAVAADLGGRSAVFLHNHGIVVVGRSVREAAILTAMLERACKIQLKVMATGLTPTITKEDELAAKREYIYSDVAIKNYWRFVKRIVAQNFGDLLI